jgi:hypothetical protein
MIYSCIDANYYIHVYICMCRVSCSCIDAKYHILIDDLVIYMRTMQQSFIWGPCNRKFFTVVNLVKFSNSPRLSWLTYQYNFFLVLAVAWFNKSVKWQTLSDSSFHVSMQALVFICTHARYCVHISMQSIVFIYTHARSCINISMQGIHLLM